MAVLHALLWQGLTLISMVYCSWREVDISALKVNPDEDNEEVMLIALYL